VGPEILYDFYKIPPVDPVFKKFNPFISSQTVSRTYILVASHDISVGIALGHGLDDRGSRVPFAAGAENFSLHHRVQNGSGSHSTSYPMGTRGLFPWE
jgi:hypothetical protein